MWYDSSLTFQNLKKDQTNYLTSKDELWTPYVMVLNMEAKEDCKEADIRTLFEVIYNENSTYTESIESEHLNTFLYKGSENPVNHESYWTCKYVCQFDYHWYPFDTQICNIKLNVSELELELYADFTKYTGNFVKLRVITQLLLTLMKFVNLKPEGLYFVDPPPTFSTYNLLLRCQSRVT